MTGGTVSAATGQLPDGTGSTKSWKNKFDARQIIAAIIGAAVGVALTFGGTWANNSFFSSNAPTIQMNQPGDDFKPDSYTFTGTASGLAPGQSVWLFWQRFQDMQGASFDGALVVSVGPCDITGQGFSCRNVRVGEPGRGNDGNYNIWATIVDPSMARDLIVRRLDFKSEWKSRVEPPALENAQNVRSKVIVARHTT